MKKIKISDKRILLVILLAFGIILIMFADDSHENIPEPTDSAMVLEQKIADLLEKTYNTDDVSVILTYDTMGEKITTADEYDSNDVFGGNNREPFVISEKLPYVRGALISAGDIPPQKTEEIQGAVATLLGISSSKVNVIISDYGG